MRLHLLHCHCKCPIMEDPWYTMWLEATLLIIPRATLLVCWSPRRRARGLVLFLFYPVLCLDALDHWHPMNETGSSILLLLYCAYMHLTIGTA